MYVYSQREVTNAGCLVRLMVYPFIVLLSRTWRILNYYTIQVNLICSYLNIVLTIQNVLLQL